jgi:hypothetical protein
MKALFVNRDIRESVVVNANPIFIEEMKGATIVQINGLFGCFLFSFFQVLCLLIFTLYSARKERQSCRSVH